MSNVRNCQGVSTVLIAFFLLISLLAAAQEKKEFRYTVGARSVISITNDCGPVTVSPSEDDQVVVTTVSYSDTVSFENEQHGNRIELWASCSRQGSRLADYRVMVTADAVVSLRSSDGALRAQGLSGDIILEAAAASVEVTDISHAHLHIKSLSGPVALTDIRDSHIDIDTVSGNVSIHKVTGSSLKVNSGSGRISYDGDPGVAGEYLFTSHSGDLDVSIPATASVEIKARSLKGKSDQVPSDSQQRAADEPEKPIAKTRNCKCLSLCIALIQRQDPPQAALISYSFTMGLYANDEESR
jgi:hypothetical protein